MNEKPLTLELTGVVLPDGSYMFFVPANYRTERIGNNEVLLQDVNIQYAVAKPYPDELDLGDHND